MFFFWLETDRQKSFTAVDCTPSPTLKLDSPLVEYFLPAAVPAAASAAESTAELAAEPTTKLAALSNNCSRIRLLLFFLSLNTSSNSYTTSSSTAFPFYDLFFYFKLSPPASLILSLLSPTVNTLLLAHLPTGLYRVTPHIGSVFIHIQY